MVSYWIQRADFSTSQHGQVNEQDALPAYQRHDWIAEVAQVRRLADSEADHCSPGIGFVTGTGDLLHVCPDGETAVVHYHFEERRKLFGLVPSRKLHVVTAEAVPPGTVLDLIRLFASGRMAAVRARLDRIA